VAIRGVDRSEGLGQEVTEADRRLLTNLRRLLLQLHRTLLDWERAAHERVHGRSSSHGLLLAILHDDRFAWLRPMSALIVRIDEWLADEGPETSIDVKGLLEQARLLVAPDEQGTPYARRYFTALQEHPDAILAHRDLMTLLKSHDGPPSRRRV